MIERRITLDELIQLASQKESHFFDKKAAEISGKQVQKIAVAFANADGGEFIIGIADEKDEPDPKRTWRGAGSLEALNGHLQAIFEVQPAYEVLTCDNEHGYGLRVIVEKSSEVHKAGDGTVYQRYGAQSLPLRDPQKLTQLTFAKGAATFEDQRLDDVVPEQIVESQSLSEFLKSYSPQTEPLDFCLNQNLLDYKTWAPRVAASLLFHSAPSAIIPRKCAVKITRYETKEDDPERDHLAEQVTVEGPLYLLIHESVQGITKLKWSRSGYGLQRGLPMRSILQKLSGRY